MDKKKRNKLCFRFIRCPNELFLHGCLVFYMFFFFFVCVCKNDYWGCIVDSIVLAQVLVSILIVCSFSYSYSFLETVDCDGLDCTHCSGDDECGELLDPFRLRQPWLMK